MPDDKTATGAADRQKVARDQQYELHYFAERHGISAAEARRILREAGTSREKADAAAMRAKQAAAIRA